MIIWPLGPEYTTHKGNSLLSFSSRLDTLSRENKLREIYFLFNSVLMLKKCAWYFFFEICCQSLSDTFDTA